MYFTPTSGNTGGNSSSRLRSLASATTPANQTCIALQGGGWTASICTPVTLTDPASNLYIYIYINYCFSNIFRLEKKIN
jgi:hypothetical protein